MGSFTVLPGVSLESTLKRYSQWSLVALFFWIGVSSVNPCGTVWATGLQPRPNAFIFMMSPGTKRPCACVSMWGLWCLQEWGVRGSIGMRATGKGQLPSPPATTPGGQRESRMWAQPYRPDPAAHRSHFMNHWRKQMTLINGPSKTKSYRCKL